MRNTHGNAIVRMFEWWNDVMAGNDPLQSGDFLRFFTADARLVVNGNVRSTNIADMVGHYTRIRSNCQEIRMVLPVAHAFSTAEFAFVHCHTAGHSLDGPIDEEAMAYAIVDGGRIARLQVVSATGQHTGQ